MEDKFKKMKKFIYEELQECNVDKFLQFEEEFYHDVLDAVIRYNREYHSYKLKMK